MSSALDIAENNRKRNAKFEAVLPSQNAACQAENAAPPPETESVRGAEKNG